MNDRVRLLIFVLISVVALGSAAVYVRFAAGRPPATEVKTGGLAVEWVEWTDGTVPKPPYMLFRSTAAGKSFGRVGYVPLDVPNGPRYLTPISCDRLYFSHGHGICLTVENSRVFPAHAYVFDHMFRLGTAIRLTGPPSRARVAPDGGLAAITVFESGHSYAEGAFSTRTSLIDTQAGRIIADLEQFDIQRNGTRFKPVDSNFWGVTFTAANRVFYATLSTGGRMYLIRADADRRAGEVLHQGVECPSLSPDGTRLAFKKRINGRLGVVWQVAVLDLATSHESVLDAEARSVDDQVEWLDETQVIYHQPSSNGADIWALRIDNRTPPRLLLTGAYSPAVVRE
jgi:hypothetical protein